MSSGWQSSSSTITTSSLSNTKLSPDTILRSKPKFFLLYTFSAIAQNKHTISGYIQDESSGENLIGVSVYEKETFKGSSSNTYGFYSLTLPQGNYTIVYSYIGMKELSVNINLNKRPEELSNEMFYKITIEYEKLFD